MLRVLSLGAGVQSTVMALLGAEGAFGPPPDCAVFADTGAEPRGVYDHLDWLEAQLPFPVHRVSAGNLARDLLEQGGRFATIPYHIAGVDGEHGLGGRQCTRDYKINPIVTKVRELLGAGKGERVEASRHAEQWIGISTDELHRVKDSGRTYITHRWPLIEARMNRTDCQAWFQRRFPGRSLVKSACVFCPYQSNELWRRQKADGEAWALAVAVDEAIRRPGIIADSLDGTAFVHRSLAPLSEADIGQDDAQADLFLGFQNECEGVCGT